MGKQRVIFLYLDKRPRYAYNFARIDRLYTSIKVENNEVRILKFCDKLRDRYLGQMNQQIATLKYARSLRRTVSFYFERTGTHVTKALLNTPGWTLEIHSESEAFALNYELYAFLRSL